MPQEGIAVDRLETHDRMLEALKQGDEISIHVQNIMEMRPFGSRPFYQFGHVRTENGFQKKVLWQSRLSKPRAATNSFLFKCYPVQDIVRPLWIIPHEFMFPLYEKGNMFESQQIVLSIFDYKHNRAKLEEPEEEDPTDEQVRAIYDSMTDEERARLFSISFLRGDSQ